MSESTKEQQDTTKQSFWRRQAIRGSPSSDEDNAPSEGSTCRRLLLFLIRRWIMIRHRRLLILTCWLQAEIDRTTKVIPRQDRRVREYLKGRVAGLKTAQSMTMEAATRPVRKWGTPQNQPQQKGTPNGTREGSAGGKSGTTAAVGKRQDGHPDDNA